MRLLLLALIPFALLAQDTTVADKVLVTAGAPAKGYFMIGPTVPFTSSDGRYISTPPTKITLAADGSFTVTLVPTTTATPANASYTAEYHITNAGATAAQYTESWVIPPSAIPLRIKDVLVPAQVPPPGNAGGGAQPPAGQLPDTSYTDIGQACQAASNAKQTLLVTKAWTALTTQTLACDLLFYTGGSLQPAAGQVVTIGGGLSAQLHQIFDTSLGGNSSIVLAPNSTPGVYPQWFGAVMGKGVPIAAQNQNLIVLDTTQHAVSGQGIPILITGRIEYNDPSTTAATGGLVSLSNLTWRGTNASAEIVATIAQTLWATINFCGTYTEATSQNCLTAFAFPSGTFHTITPANVGSTTLTSNPTGGFANIQVGSWIVVAEGTASGNYGTFRSYHTVTAINGDQITLDRPTEFDFTGATDPTAVDGVVLIAPAHDVVVENLKITQGAGANSAYLVFNMQHAANITFRNCTFATEGAYDAEGYACWSYKVNLIHNNWTSGAFDGWCGGSWGIEDGDVSMNVMGAMNAGGGANHVSVVNSFFAGPTSSPDMISGPFYHATFANNQFANFNSTPVISVAGYDVRIVNNSFVDNSYGIKFDTTVRNNDLLRTHDITISNNYFSSKKFACMNFPNSANLLVNLVGVGNTFNCTNPGSMTSAVDTNGVTWVGNIDIQQRSLFGTVTVPGYTSGTPYTGGVLNGNQQSNIPIIGGMLRSVLNYPGSTQSYNAGDIVLLNPANFASNQNAAMLLTKTAGTIGTLSGGVTANAVSGSNVVTIVNSPGSVVVGRYYAIAGTTAPRKFVWQLDATHWQTDVNMSATVSGAAVTYSQPVFIQISGRQAQMGTCNLAGAGPFTCSSTFATAFLAAPACTASNQSAAFAVQASATLTAVTLTGETGSASGNVINWTCTGNPN